MLTHINTYVIIPNKSTAISVKKRFCAVLFPAKIYRPATHPIILPSVSPDKILRLYCVGGIFFLGKPYLENFMSRPDVIPTFCQRRCKTGVGTSFGANGDQHTRAAEPSTYFCVLTIRKQLPGNGFERSGRGQEPSRGHKFSILENSCPFGTASCWGVPAPNPARNEYSKLELIYFVCKSSRKKIPSVRLTNISLSLIT